LDVERNLNTHTHTKLISEMINIKSQSKGLSLQTDTDSLNQAYFLCLSNI